MIVGFVILFTEGYCLCYIHEAPIVNMNVANILIAPTLLILAISYEKDIRIASKLRHMGAFMYFVHPIFIALAFHIGINSPVALTVIVTLSSYIASLFVVRLMNRHKLLRSFV